MNDCHPNMKFTFEKEQNQCFKLLIVKVVRENDIFTTSVYHEPTCSVYTRFDSYMPLNFKFQCTFYNNFSQFHYIPRYVDTIKIFVKLKTF